MASGTSQATGPVARWRRVRDELLARGPGDLSADELDTLADAWFWIDDPDASMSVRRDAYRGHVAGGDDRRAAASAWRLFYDHFLVGELAPADGWLARCRRHVERARDPTADGWLAVADSDRAAAGGDAASRLRRACEAVDAARATGDADLLAMALQAEGRARVDAGDHEHGVLLLDEAMVAVVNDELQPLYTGWVYCNVVSTCYSLADLRRAGEWSDAALRWCSTMSEGLMYPGLCRVYAVELDFLRGDWAAATDGVARACAELHAFDPRYAGPAHVLAGDLARVRGDLDRAETEYRRAHELGATPQPGLALLRLARGDRDEALRSLRVAMRSGPGADLPRTLLLAAVADVATLAGDVGTLTTATTELDAIASRSASSLIGAIATAARAELVLWHGDAATAVVDLQRAVAELVDQSLRYEAARRRVRCADAAEQLGDRDLARLELAAAVGVFAELGAAADLAHARRRLQALHANAASTAASTAASPLTSRELAVLQLVAAGHTNREVADELVISPHTVDRHMSNIRTKLGVSSRAAATALAYERGWLGDRP